MNNKALIQKSLNGYSTFEQLLAKGDNPTISQAEEEQALRDHCHDIDK